MEIIWNTIVGSNLYGLQTEDSDVDYKGIYMPNRENIYPTKYQLLGLDNFNADEKTEFCDGDGSNKKKECIILSYISLNYT